MTICSIEQITSIDALIYNYRDKLQIEAIEIIFRGTFFINRKKQRKKPILEIGKGNGIGLREENLGRSHKKGNRSYNYRYIILSL